MTLLLIQNVGAFFGIYAFSKVTAVHRAEGRHSRSGVRAGDGIDGSSPSGTSRRFNSIFWMIPMMGFCQLSLFGGYAIYFPELFPTRLRSTGTSFCYNVGRLVAATGPLTLGLLTSEVYGGWRKIDPTLPSRYAGMTMCAVFLIGLCVLPFAPETKGRPLPE